ncbi:MAG TPA: efflux RND transporter permease subunit [Alphaproteobacteria bacterium]|nr:efflux RND transporter permease subunit [Alphaproteobacteria bacterium]HQS94290.1 efflux RND transporter permease subunit [Alphaproteobacteria bacterium]
MMGKGSQKISKIRMANGFFTDIFIQKPTFAVVLSLLILILGLRSLDYLPIRQYPFTQNAVVLISTTYAGADPELISGFITTPLEKAIAQANGIDYLVSNSTQGQSSIRAILRLNYDPNRALTEVITKVNSVLNLLPKDAQSPSLSISIGDDYDSLYIGFSSEVLENNQITDYLTRVVAPQLQSVTNVQLAEILGSKEFALRAWLDPNKMASFGITAADVSKALSQNNFISAVGRTDGQMVTVDLVAETGLHTVEEFQNLILKSKDDVIIRLKDVAKVALGAENYDTEVAYDEKKAVFIGIKVASSANVLTVIQDVKQRLPRIFKELPEGLQGEIVYDQTRFIKSSISEVEHSLIEAMVIVIGVIFLFLGTFRSVLIPLVAIPLSLIGTFFIMMIFGFTINLLTLLALVLAIGLVVDDAIIIVENVYRHMEKGLSALEASLMGARELAQPIIAITIVLIAVYVPIAFLEGLTGALFMEFAFTLAGAVFVSAIIALTLSPLMCSKLLKSHQQSALLSFIDRQFLKIQLKYAFFLKNSFHYLPVTLVFAGIVVVSNYSLYMTSQRELAPQEDQGFIRLYLKGEPNANLSQTKRYAHQIQAIMATIPEKDHTLQLVGIEGLNTAYWGFIPVDWKERKKTSTEIQNNLQKLLSKITGGDVSVYQPPSLPGFGGYPLQFIIQTTDSFEDLDEVSQKFLEKAKETGMFAFLETDLRIDKEKISLEIDREKAAVLGLTMEDIGNGLSAAYSNGYINYFAFNGRSYQVIPQIMRESRLNPEDLETIYLKTPTQGMIPLSTVASLKSSVVPRSLSHFQQLNAAIISGAPMPGVTIGGALETLKQIAQETLPGGYSIDYAGPSRQYEQESASLVVTFFFALLIIYLSLTFLFESFRDPLVVLISVPLSVCGAMIFINLGVGGASLNIYTEVGLVTLIGLISKHGILIVQFANDLQREGYEKTKAILSASEIRLRPILMTTCAMVLGVVPLLLAQGAGAESRFQIGLVIASGISIGTIFTLFVVPAMYMVLGVDFSKTKRKSFSEK